MSTVKEMNIEEMEKAVGGLMDQPKDVDYYDWESLKNLVIMYKEAGASWESCAWKVYNCYNQDNKFVDYAHTLWDQITWC